MITPSRAEGMNPNHPRPEAPIAAEQLDRLVDGALSGADRRALIARLEADGDGWKRCALAFLEAQGWREALGPLSRAAEEDEHDGREDRAASARPSRRPLPMPARLAMAAGLAAIAFGLGWSLGGARPSPSPTAPDPGPVLIADGDGQRVDPEAVSENRAVASTGVEEADGRGWDTAEEVRAIGLLQVPAVAGVGAPPVHVPVLAGPGLDEAWLRVQPSFVPDEVRQRWEDQGYRVEHQRRLVSVQVDDEGRYLAIPVDEVNLHYVGLPSY